MAKAGYVSDLPRRSPQSKTPVVLLTALLVVVAIGVAVYLTTRKSTPGLPADEQVVSDYLSALQHGDASTALAQGSGTAVSDFTSNEVLKAQQKLAPFANIFIRSHRVQGDAATVTVGYTVGGKHVDATFALSRASGSWKLDRATADVDLTGVSDDGLDPGLTLFGRPVPSNGIVATFPGALDLRWNTYVSGAAVDAGQTFPVQTGAWGAEVSPRVDASAQGRLFAAMDTYLAGCAKAKKDNVAAEDEGDCPVNDPYVAFLPSRPGTANVVPGSFTYTVTGHAKDFYTLTAASPTSVDFATKKELVGIPVTADYTRLVAASDGTGTLGSDDCAVTAPGSIDLPGGRPKVVFSPSE